MKRILSIIIVTSLIFLVGFVFLRLDNEEFAAKMLDDVGLNSQRIRKNIVNHTGSGAVMSGDVSTGATMSGSVLSGSILSGSLLTGSTTTGDIATGAVATGN